MAWHKSKRRIFNIPHTTHCIFLIKICGDMPVRDQLYLRFINFYKSLLNSGNKIIQTCANLALHSSNYILSNNITIIFNRLFKSRYEINLLKKSNFHYNVTLSDEASVIRDILHQTKQQHYNMFIPTCSQFLNRKSRIIF